jgi:peptide chain release factor 3
MSQLAEHIAKRRTFAIISHPDAGKTTITEKLLFLGGALQSAGSIRAKKTGQYAASDWMAMEQQRGISVTSSAMQFIYNDKVINLLDTPGHADFSEDTYRTLTAVDSVLMVIDGVKGVEQRTIKLMEICRMRDTPIITFINKLDRGTKDAYELIDEIEKVLDIHCAPITWPIGSGTNFLGVYHLLSDEIHLYTNYDKPDHRPQIINGLDSAAATAAIEAEALTQLREEIELLKEASEPFDPELYLAGMQTPVFFGTAMSNFGVNLFLDLFSTHAPAPTSHATTDVQVNAADAECTGFVFKIQANMDPKHRDRIAFLRICSGEFTSGMKWYHCASKKQVNTTGAVTFLAGKREKFDTAYPGDIVGLFNHGTIAIGDTFTQGKDLKFTGIPHFAPELFKSVIAKDPLKAKQLQKGLVQLSEEGATQAFMPQKNNQIILGAVGVLQFEVVSFRLQHEYQVECLYQEINLYTVRWLFCDDETIFNEFKKAACANLAVDQDNYLVYLAPSRVNLSLTQEKWPQIKFATTREH